MTAISLDHFTLAATGFDYALQQPIFPGKLILWALFMLSLLSWGVIVSKGITLFRMRRSDDEFNRHYRAMRQPLQIFERNYRDDLSMRWVIYDHGAQEAAFQMLGSPERDETFCVRLRSSEGLAPTQMKAVREGLLRGEMAAAAKLREGMALLSLTSMGAPFLGLLGMAWILMKTFSQGGMTGTLADVSPGVSGGLAMLVVGLIVATPALLAQILLGGFTRDRLRKLGDFRSEVGRSIEHFYNTDREIPLAAAASGSRAHRAHHAQPGASYTPRAPMDGRAIEHAAASLEASADSLPYSADSPFVLIDPSDEMGDATSPIAAFANPEDDAPDVGDEFLFRTPFAESEINPIARQTTGRGGRQTVLA